MNHKLYSKREAENNEKLFADSRMDSRMISYLKGIYEDIRGTRPDIAGAFHRDDISLASALLLYRTLRYMGANPDLSAALIRENPFVLDFYPGLQGGTSASEIATIMVENNCGPAEAMYARTKRRIKGAYMTYLDKRKLEGLELLATEERLAKQRGNYSITEDRELQEKEAA